MDTQHRNDAIEKCVTYDHLETTIVWIDLNLCFDPFSFITALSFFHFHFHIVSLQSPQYVVYIQYMYINLKDLISEMPSP